MNNTRLRFFSWRCHYAWLLAFAVAVFLAALRFGPLAEQTTIECVFASLILAGLALFAIAASGRIAFGLLAGSLPMLLLVIAANLKFRYLSTPLLAPDLVYYFNAEIAQTLLRYPFIIAAIVAAIVLVPLLLALLWRGDFRPGPNLATRSARAFGVAAAIALLAVTLYPRGPFAPVYDKGMWEAMNDESFVTDFVVSIRNAHVSTPRFRTADANHDDWRDLASGTAAGTRKPDIVAVLEESTFDPRM
ncbi:MAG: hypothetical protein KGQ32_13045, partial [Xanthomonadaceae bacterium]|nr:hypothetical protein [Xanthomonadaceae bacterium]